MKLSRPIATSFGVAAIMAAGLSVPGSTIAGDFHRLVGPIANGGGTNCTWTTPKNASTAMEMDVFEFGTPAIDGYRCSITGNTTGQDLTVRLIGLTGLPLASFTTAVNGVGSTPYVVLGSPFLFQCTVSSGAGSPVNGGNYRVCAQRQ